MKEGLSKGQMDKLRNTFPYERPRVNDSMEKIQRMSGQQDVIEYLLRTPAMNSNT